MRRRTVVRGGFLGPCSVPSGVRKGPRMDHEGANGRTVLARSLGVPWGLVKRPVPSELNDHNPVDEQCRNLDGNEGRG